MAKDTLLDIVQGILSDADGDEVNSISDTVESDQCARVVRMIHDNIVDQNDLAYHEQLKKLTATGASTPCIMQRPAGLYAVEVFKYDKKTTAGGDQRYEKVLWMEPQDFLDFTESRTLSDTEVEAMTLPDSGHIVLIRNDRAPTYVTQLDGYDDFIFDAYDSSLETNLQNSKSMVMGIVKPVLALSDGAIPDLPEHLFNQLKNSSRAYYFDVYKDGVTREIDKLARRSEVRAQRHRHITKNLRPERTGQDYGRK